MKVYLAAAGLLSLANINVQASSDANFLKNVLSGIICDEENNLDSPAAVCHSFSIYTDSCIDIATLIWNAENCDDHQLRRKRSLDSNTWSASIIDSIDGYGCWCYFGDEVGNGYGSPLTGNKVDEHCKELQHGYYCMLRDHADGDTGGSSSCDPTNVSYVSATGFAMMSANTVGLEAAIMAACNMMNSNGCEARACAIEGYFLLNIFKLFLSGEYLDMDMKHSKGILNVSQTCPRTIYPSGTGGLAVVDYKCCGEYPLRFEHRIIPGENKDCCAHHWMTQDGSRGCCDASSYYAKTFTASGRQCCDDGDTGRNIDNGGSCT